MLLLGAGSRAFGQLAPTDILGEWTSPKKDSRILIYQQGDRFFGKIVWGTGGPDRDVKNPDAPLRSRPLVGAVILSGFSYQGDLTWVDGSIYDPREGKTYSCKMTLKSKRELSIRGYVGLSLFGRTEVWTKP